MNAVEQTIFTDLGIRVIVKPFELTDKFEVLGGYDIAPSMCGPLAPMFESVKVVVKVGVHHYNGGTTIHLMYEYSYDHVNGGRNGYTVRKEVAL